MKILRLYWLLGIYIVGYGLILLVITLLFSVLLNFWQLRAETNTYIWLGFGCIFYPPSLFVAYRLYFGAIQPDRTTSFLAVISSGLAFGLAFLLLSLLQFEWNSRTEIDVTTLDKTTRIEIVAIWGDPIKTIYSPTRIKAIQDYLKTRQANWKYQLNVGGVGGIGLLFFSNDEVLKNLWLDRSSSKLTLDMHYYKYLSEVEWGELEQMLDLPVKNNYLANNNSPNITSFIRDEGLVKILLSLTRRRLSI